MKSKKSIVLVAMALMTSYGFGQNRYVATSGSDASNDCSNSNSPCLTVQHAVVEALNNDNILISSGNYSFSSTLDLNKEGIILTAADITQKPVITSMVSNVITVSSPKVTISNLIFKLGLTSNSGLKGIVATSNYKGVKILNNEFYSTKTTTPLSGGMTFGAYAIHFYEPSTDSVDVTIKNNIITRESANKDVFGRGIGIGLAGSGKGPGGLVLNNTIDAFYSIQIVGLKDNLMVSKNLLSGMTNIGYNANNSVLTLDDNVLDLVSDQFAEKIYTVLEIKAIKDASVIVSNNTIKNYLNTGILSMASRNISIVGNTFTPSATATEFASVFINTKLMTSGTQTNTYLDEVVIKGNTFNAGVADKGIAISFADHFGANTPAFGNVIIGGTATSDKNTFDVALGNYITLDSLSGSSDSFPLWNPPFGTTGDHTPSTIMKPVSQNFLALKTENNYVLTSNQEIEDKNIDSLDVIGLGKIIISYTSDVSVKDNSFLHFSLFPNPTNNNFKVSMDNDNNASMEVIDETGRVVLNSSIQNGEVVNVEFLKSGLYFVKIISGDTYFTTKLIKE